MTIYETKTLDEESIAEAIRKMLDLDDSVTIRFQYKVHKREVFMQAIIENESVTGESGE